MNRTFLVLMLAGCASTQPGGATSAWRDTETSGPPREEPALPDVSGRPDLRELLSLALARNPEIRAARLKLLAAGEVGAIDGALPDPQLGNAKRLQDLYERVLIPRAETAARTAEDLHAAGKGTLAGTLETIAVLHNFRLAAARACADHGQAVAALEAILGKPLERST